MTKCYYNMIKIHACNKPFIFIKLYKFILYMYTFTQITLYHFKDFDKISSYQKFYVWSQVVLFRTLLDWLLALRNLSLFSIVDLLNLCNFCNWLFTLAYFLYAWVTPFSDFYIFLLLIKVEIKKNNFFSKKRLTLFPCQSACLGSPTWKHHTCLDTKLT